MVSKGLGTRSKSKVEIRIRNVSNKNVGSIFEGFRIKEITIIASLA